jgi:hypothetical protein
MNIDGANKSVTFVLDPVAARAEGFNDIIIDKTSLDDSLLETLKMIQRDLEDIKNYGADKQQEPRCVIHGIATRMDEFSSVLRHLHSSRLPEKVNAIMTKVERLSANIAYLHQSMQSLLDENNDLRHRQLQRDSSLIEVRKMLLHVSEKQDHILGLLLASNEQATEEDDEYHPGDNSNNSTLMSPTTSTFLSSMLPSAADCDWLLSAPTNQEHSLCFIPEHQDQQNKTAKAALSGLETIS